jgi:hypothetical protein
MMVRWHLSLIFGVVLANVSNSLAVKACDGINTFLIADRVSANRIENQKIFLDGVKSVLSATGLTGEVYLIVAREKGVGLREVAKVCLNGVTDEVEAKTRFERELTENKEWDSRLVQTIGKLFGTSVRENQALADRMQRVKSENREEWNKRKMVLDAAKQLTADPAKLAGEVDLLQGIASYAHDRCSGNKDCAFLVFSALIDDRSKNALSADARNIRELGNQHATYMLENLKVNQNEVRASVRVWGFGNSDGSGVELSTEKRRRLQEFWTAAFSALNMRPLQFGFTFD